MGQFQDDGRLPGPPSEAAPSAASAIRAVLVSEVIATPTAGVAATAAVATLQKLADLGAQVFTEYRGTVFHDNESITADFADPPQPSAPRRRSSAGCCSCRARTGKRRARSFAWPWPADPSSAAPPVSSAAPASS